MVRVLWQGVQPAFYLFLEDACWLTGSLEREVVMLLLRGQGMMEIAGNLSISPSTASTLKGRAFTKLNVQSVIELSHLAYHLGIHPDEAML